MANPYGPFRLFAVIALTVGWIATLPERAWDIAARIVLLLPTGDVARHLSDLFRGPPALALAGPAGDQIDASTYHRNRHEAGMSRLGAVRHR